MSRQQGDLSELGDFTATPRMIAISLIAIAIGAVSAYVAKGLLTLIGLFTNLFFFQRLEHRRWCRRRRTTSGRS